MTRPAEPLARAGPLPHQRTPAPSPDWRRLVEGVLADPSRLRLVVQPIVALQQGAVVGYEALSRFDGPRELTPDRWFVAADDLGLGAELEAVAVDRALGLLDTVPAGCFLTVNVSPHLLAAGPVLDLLRRQEHLRPLVVELTEHREVLDLTPLVLLREELVAAGGLLALDDTGAGYSGLQQMSRLRPHLIKLDRALVSDADADEVKLALAELVGQFAGRIDAWLLAEGVETWGELEAFCRLQVPLAQGYLLGRPADPWPQLTPEVQRRLRRSAARARLVEDLASLVEAAPDDAGGPVPRGRVGLRRGAHGDPVALLLPLQRDGDDGHRAVPVSLRAPGSAGVVDVLRRAVARPASCRFDPVVVVDDRGAAVGVVTLERLLLRVADLKAGPA